MDGLLVTPGTLPESSFSRLSADHLLPSEEGTGQYAGYAVQRMPTAVPAALFHKPAVAQEAPQTPQHLTGGVNLSDPRLRVNFIAADHIPLEKLVPGPPRACPALKGDAWLDWAGSKPGTIKAPVYVGELDSATWIQAQLQERQRIEAVKDEFVFQPLLTTLENMQVLIRHIQDGLQFPEPLTEEEAAALARLQAQTTALATAKTPYYKRTVGLALSLTLLCEMVTQRQILLPLLAEQPKLKSRIGITELPGGQADRAALLATLPWTSSLLDRQEKSDNQSLLDTNYEHGVLLDILDDQTRLVFPSFHPLTTSHFCRFAHCPLYPVGLTTDYALSADGVMMSPMDFAQHDLNHMRDIPKVGKIGFQGATPVESLLCSRARRLALCQLLLDATPESLAALTLEPALHLILFELLHEIPPSSVSWRIQVAGSPFLFFLETVTRVRREIWANYSPDDRRGTDRERTEAALWAARLWTVWQGTDPATPELLHEHGQAFMRRDLPGLRAHLNFLDKHWGTLRQLFVEICSRGASDKNRNAFDTNEAWPQEASLTVFQHRLENTGLCHLDNTDRAYFAALHSPTLRQLMETATGEDLPPGTAEEACLAQDDAMAS